MKKMLVILAGVMMLFALTGCGPKDKINEEIKIGKESDINITNRDINLKIKEGTLNNTGATLIIENNSDITISFGKDYGLQIEQNGKWHYLEIINQVAIEVPLYHLKANEIKEMSISWGYAFGKLPKGKYRITKGITLEFENDKKEDTYVVGEFTIN